jgi:hypothetical protein
MSLFSNFKKTSQRRKLYKYYLTLLGKSDRVSLLNAQEIAILLDELEIWKYEEFIPFHSIHIPAVEKSDKPLGIYNLLMLNAHNKIHNKATKGKVADQRIALKCRKTGLVQPISPKQ